jgi:hypothetical protein
MGMGGGPGGLGGTGAGQIGAENDDDEVPDLVENFEVEGEKAEEGKEKAEDEEKKGEGLEELN